MSTTDSGAGGMDRVINLCEEFLRDYHHDDIAALAQEGGNGITVDFADLYTADQDLAWDLHENPRTMLPAFEQALRDYELGVPVDVPEKTTVWFEGIDLATPSVSEIRVDEDHIDTLSGIRGQVSMVSQVLPKYESLTFECQRCGTTTDIYQGDTLSLQMPNECPGCERKGPWDDVGGQKRDHQIIKLSPLPSEAARGATDDVIVHAYDDLAGQVSAGDRVQINGVIETESIRESDNSSRRDLVVEARGIEKEQVAFEDTTPEREEEILELSNRPDLFDAMVESFAPSIVGHDTVKLAIILQMFGGVKHTLADGTDKRGDIHNLCIGAPGTAKSQMLSAANTIAPKSVKASGKGASAAGLTAAAKRPEMGDGGWMLDAGALVLANGGLAAIDELDKMKDDAQQSMHEALEDQEIPINKAGINTVLESQTSVLGAANPKYGRFDRYEPVVDQITLGEALISRFDGIFAFVDNPDEERDEAIAAGQHAVAVAGEDPSASAPIETDLLREYIAYARQHFEPSYPSRDSEAYRRAVEWYPGKRQENGGDDDRVPITARKNDSIRRFAQASARARLSDEITVEDVERAIEIQRTTLGVTHLDDEGNLDADKATTGTAKNQRDRMRRVLELIKELGDSDGGPTRDEIATAAKDEGMDGAKVDHTLDKLSEQGEIYQPSGRGYRTT